MTSHLIRCLAVALSATAVYAQDPSPTPSMSKSHVVLVVNGGAGTIERSKMTPEREREYRTGIENALRAGTKILCGGGAALDAVEAAVRVLEDDPHFNAGKGSVFTSAGTNEMDAAIMDGRTRSAGAVAGVEHVRNPIVLARAIMEKSKHVFLIGSGAEEFAKRNKIELVDTKYFFTQDRWDALQKVKATENGGGSGDKKFIISDADRHGTVGAVALDGSGNLAAATSTGGTTNKLPGRVGDSPVIGAGTFADNNSCAVSCTGDGEFFIRAAVAHEISTLIEHRGVSLREAAESALAKSQKLGGSGGLIAVDKNGNIALPFNTSGMYRGFLREDGTFVVDIYRDR